MRVFVFGIDGLTIKIMKPLMDRGIIPNFKFLYESGNKGALKSTIPPLTPPGWASIYTGKNPGKHGLFEFNTRNGFTTTTNTCWDYAEAPPLWKHLSDHGKRCILLNVPMYYPPLKIRDCCSVSGFPAVETLNIYYPESFKRELLQRVPDYRIDTFWRHEILKGKEEAFIKDNIKLTESRIHALNYLMKEKSWDFFFVVFTGTDRLQHFLWSEIEKGNPEVTQYYKVLDDAIGNVLNFLESKDFLFVVSDHGFGPVEKAVNINGVLQQAGLLSIKKSVEVPISYRKLARWMENRGIKGSLRKILPRSFIDKFQKHAKMEGVFHFSKIDWMNTKAVGWSGKYGGISVNLKDREPHGIVSESEYESVRDSIIQAFSSLQESEKSGKKVIKSINRREDVYSGSNIGKMPDVVLLAETGYLLDGTIDNGDIFREARAGHDKQIIMEGEHEVDSIFIIKHDSFNTEYNEISITDIAPSVLNIFGLPIPTSMDGKTLFENYTPAIYIDELTGTLFKKQGKKSSNIHSKLKNLKN